MLKRTSFRPFGTITFMVVAGALQPFGGQSLFLTSAQAQVPAVAPEPGGADKQKDARDLMRLQKSLKKTITDDPNGALRQYRRFLAERPTIEPQVGVLANHLIAQILYRQLSDAPQASAVYDEALAKYKDDRSSQGLLTEKAALLLAQDKNAEAQALLQQAWPQIAENESRFAEPFYAGPMLYQLSVALLRQNHKEEVVPLLEDAFTSVPGLLDDGQQGKADSKFAGQFAPKAGWMYDLLTSLLVEQGHPDRALGWAKVRWMTCNFEDASVGRAARMMARQWTVAQPKGTRLVEFIAHQKSGSKEADPQPDSYEKITLPAFDQTKLQAYLKKSQNKDGQTLVSHYKQKTSVHILLGQWNEAMSEAITYLLKRPRAAERVQQVARVLKAADGDMVRANAFTVYFRQGTEVNPLEGFFNDYPKSATVTTPPPVPSSVLVADVTAASGQLKTGATYAAPVPIAALTVPLVAKQAAREPDTSTAIEEMWKKGLLSVEDVLYTLTRGGIDGDLLTENHAIKAQLAGVIVRHGQDVDSPELRNPRVRLSLGDYYHSQKDFAHATEVFSSLVEQGRGRGTPTRDGKVWRAWYYLVSLERLGEVYKAQGDNTRFEEMWTKVRQEEGPNSEIYRSATLILARHYTDAGQKEKAKVAYVEAASGTGWVAIMAVWDRADDLAASEQYKPALELLQPALEATKTRDFDDRTDDAGRNPKLSRMGLLTLAAFCHLQIGEKNEAEKLSREAIALYETSDVTANLGIEGQVEMARDTLEKATAP